MRKLIAILTALMMILGAVSALAEEGEQLEFQEEMLGEVLDVFTEESEDPADETEAEADDWDDGADWQDWGEEAVDDGTLIGGLAGGWQVASDPTVTPELKAIFDKGMEGLVGVNYVPMLYLGSQVVAGTNHAFLCQATTVVPDAQPEWMVVYLYQDLQGSISVLDIGGFDVGAFCDFGSDEEE